MGNPYLERQEKNNFSQRGRKSEERVAKSLAARLHPNSGAARGCKSDASKANFRLEMKSSSKLTLPLELGWLVKITQEALQHGQLPAVVVSFVDAQGKPVMSRNAEWVLIPKEVFKELADGAD